jgi:hypothetical protein
METIVITSKQIVPELYKSKTRQELSLNKTSDEVKKDHSTLISTNSQKKKKIVKFNMQKMEIVEIESYKKYNADNAFDECKSTRIIEKETYHCKCIIF